MTWPLAFLLAVLLLCIFGSAWGLFILAAIGKADEANRAQELARAQASNTKLRGALEREADA